MGKLNWRRVRIAPDDILDALKSLPVNTVWSQSLIPSTWIPAESFYGWAEEAYSREDQFGWNAAVTYASRAVCRRIDGLLLNNHLGRHCGSRIPDKIGILSEIAIPMPSIVHRHLVRARNIIEHEYQQATEEQARDLVELAQLILNSTVDEANRPAVIVLGGRVEHSFAASASPPAWKGFTFGKFSDEPVLFVDFMESPAVVKVIDPESDEIRFSALSDFTKADAIEFALHLRRYPGNTMVATSPWIGLPPELTPDIEVFRQFKEQANL